MKTYLHAQGFEFSKSIVDGYKEPIVPPTNESGRKLMLNNSKDTNEFLNGQYMSELCIVSPLRIFGTNF